MANTSFTLATFNVRNLVNAGVEYYGGRKYSQPAFDRKIDWLSDQLIRMDADFVCLQEVFHPEALQALADAYVIKIAAKGLKDAPYQTVLHCPNDDTQPDDPRPGLGFLSRGPVLEHAKVQDLTGNEIKVGGEDGFSYQLGRISRPIQMVRADLGLGVEGWIFNAHLKSKRPLMPEGSPASDPENAMFLERSYGVFRSLALRAGEALALRREILAKMTGTSTPVMVVGDLNDEIGAVTTEMVAGEAPYRNFDFEVKKQFWDVELYSAARTHLRRSEHASFYTHIYNGHYGTIDHILVSQEFYYRNRNRLGDINAVMCFNDHLTDDSLRGAPRLGDASDHGQLAVKITIDEEAVG